MGTASNGRHSWQTPRTPAIRNGLEVMARGTVMPRKIRFSIARLMGVVLVAAVGSAALRNASEAWAGSVLLVTCGAVMLAIVGALSRGPDERAWWLGFAFFGGGYLALLSWTEPSTQAAADDRAGGIHRLAARHETRSSKAQLGRWLGFAHSDVSHRALPVGARAGVPRVASGRCPRRRPDCPCVGTRGGAAIRPATRPIVDGGGRR